MPDVYKRQAYGSAEEREERKMLVGNGIYANPATNMQVVADNGMTVKVKPGACWIEGAFGVVDNDESKTLTASENGRIDLIVARFDLSLSARDIHIDVIQGTEGSTSPPVSYTHLKSNIWNKEPGIGD